jgi:hypothetical protein
MIPEKVLDYISIQKQEFQPQLKTLAGFLAEGYPELELRMVSNSPFYHGRKRILYLVVIEKAFIRLGFCQGEKLFRQGVNFTGYGKEVAYLDFHSTDQIESDQLKEKIDLAIWLDETVAKSD